MTIEDFRKTVEEIVAKIPDEPAGDRDDERRERLRRQQALEEFVRIRGRLHASCTLENFDTKTEGQRVVRDALAAYRDNLDAEVECGAGIVLFGASGTGKDHLLTALAIYAIQRGHDVAWCNGMDLYGEIRDRIHNDEAEASWVARMTRPAVLYISDPLPPIGDLTPFQAQMLQRILDRRTRMRRPVWVSLNVTSSGEADRRMGASLVDRLKPGSIAAYCNWPSYRKVRMVWPRPTPT